MTKRSRRSAASLAGQSAGPPSADLRGDRIEAPTGSMASDRIGSATGAAAPRSLKRSITVRPDIDAAVREMVGDGAYSEFVNRALLMAIQARGIDTMVERFEAEHGPLTAEDFAQADRRRAEAHRLAAERAERP